jgi:DNA-binding response OmpR family regulator
MMNILLIIDDQAIANAIADALTAWGHKTERAVTGADALERSKQRHFDLVLMELSLPDIHGYELIPRIKRYQPEAGIVTMTNSNSRELELQVRKQGIIYYMVKPLNIQIIREIVEHMEMDKFGKVQVQGKFS